MADNRIFETPRRLWQQLRHWKPGRLAYNTTLATFWQGIRLILQFFYLVLIARMLGSESYGLFSGIVALAASLSPLVGFGFEILLVKEIARSPARFPISWAKALRAIVISAPPLVVGVIIFANFLILPGTSLSLVALIVVSELVTMPLITLASHAYQAHERLGWAIFNHVQLNLIRLVTIIGLVFMDVDGVREFALAYFGATFLAAILSLIQVRFAFGAPEWQVRIKGQIREGLTFSFSAITNSAHNEIDKTLVLRLDSAIAAGNYSLASRLISAATMPLITYILTAIPRLFRTGESGVTQTMHLALKLFPPVFFYGGLVALGILACAPLLPLVFGTDFTAALSILYWLAPVPLLIGLSKLILAIFSASGYQTIRLSLEVASLILNIILNVTLIPLYAALGAAFAMLFSQALLVVLSCFVLLNVCKNMQKTI